VLGFMGGIAVYLYFFLKVDKMYARKGKRRKGRARSKDRESNSQLEENSSGTDGPRNAYDAATAVVSAVFQSPHSLVSMPVDKVPSETEQKSPEVSINPSNQLDEMTNRPPPVLIKPMPFTSATYNTPLDVDKLPAHLFGGKQVSSRKSFCIPFF
jgi:hypothetical protein